MSEKSSSAPSGGIGILGLLGVVFITLKLVGVINWSWWLVLLPLYGGITAVIIGAVVWLLVWLTVEVVRSLKQSRR